MATQLENMKYLRSIGASIKLQDDVAKKVGGYDSPLFIPTVEFILKLQHAFGNKSKKQEKQASYSSLPNVFDPSQFKGIDLDSVQDKTSDLKMGKAQKKQAAEYVGTMIEKRDEFLDKNLDFDAEKNLIPRRKKGGKQQAQAKTVKKTNLISMIADSIKNAVDQLNQNSQNSQRRQNNQQQGQQQTQQQSTRVRLNQRRNLMSLFAIKRNIMEHAHHEHEMHAHDHDHDHDKQAGQEAKKKPSKDEFLKKLKKDHRIIELQESMEKRGMPLSDSDLLGAAKSAKKELGDVSKDLIISKMINEVVKTAEKKEGNKSAVLDEAAAKLSNIGVKAITSPEQQINNKKALEGQQAQQDPNAQLKR